MQHFHSDHWQLLAELTERFLFVVAFPLCSRWLTNKYSAKVHSELEMSDLSSRALVNEEDSCCESESAIERPKEGGKTKNRRKRKVSRNFQAQRDLEVMDGNTDDETESQINYQATPANSTLLPSPMSVHTQDKMRRRLQFFFMNPIEKWQAKRRWAVERTWNAHNNQWIFRIAGFLTSSWFKSSKSF